MFHPDRRAFPFGIGIAAVCGLLLLGAATPIWADATQAQCDAEWSESSADDDCSNEEITAEADDCRITASCTMGDGGSRTDTFVANLNKISTLVNCQRPSQAQ